MFCRYVFVLFVLSILRLKDSDYPVVSSNISVHFVEKKDSFKNLENMVYWGYFTDIIVSGYQWGPCCSSSPVISGVLVAHHLRLSVGSMLLIISGYQWGPCCSSSPVINGVHVAHHLRLSVGSMLFIISDYQWGPCCSSSPVISEVHVVHHLRLSVGSMLPIISAFCVLFFVLFVFVQCVYWGYFIDILVSPSAGFTYMLHRFKPRVWKFRASPAEVYIVVNTVID